MRNIGTKTKFTIALEFLRNSKRCSELARTHGLATAQAKAFSVRLRQSGHLAFAPSHLATAVAALAANRKLSVVQVGANDGSSGDPVHKLFHAHARKALLVEPIPELIGALKEAYRGFSGQLSIANLAIGDGGNTFHLHRLRPGLWPEYIEKVGRHPSAVSSFDRSLVFEKMRTRLGLSDEEADAAVECLSCPTMTLAGLIEKYGFEDVDLLQIDCEGYDYMVIESLGTYRPHIINFESFNLSPEHWEAWKQWAAANGYGFIQGHMDTLAIRGLRSRQEL